MASLVQHLPSLFLFLSLLNFSINGNPAVKPSNSACLSSYCRNGLVLGYPFWIQNQQSEYCGYPGFGLSCSGQEPILHLSGDLYRVKKINSSENTLTVAFPETATGTCPVAPHGVTLNTTSFFYTKDVKMVSFFYNCSLYPPSIPSMACLQYGAKRSYVFMEGAIPEFDWLRFCESIVTVPMIEKAVNSDLLVNSFGRALGDGFKLTWKVPEVACQSCEATGGFCGYGNGIVLPLKFICFCADGQHFANCNDKGVVSVTFRPNLAVIGALIVGSLIITSTAFYIIQRKKINLYTPVSSRMPNNGK